MEIPRRDPYPLPSAPLELADALSLPPPAPAGTEVLAEAGLVLWRLLRAVHAWAAGADADPAAALAWEEEVLRGDWGAALWAPASVVAGEVALGAEGDPRTLAEACLAVADAALAAGWTETALAFAQGAGLAWPSNPRVAWVAGKMLRKHGRYREAELWLRRSTRLAVWFKDWEWRALSLNSLAMLAWEQGSFAAARETLVRARAVARKHGLQRREGEILHDTFVVEASSGNRKQAEEAAQGALERYLPDHPRLPALAYDLAYHWLKAGYPDRAILVLPNLLPHFEEPIDRLFVTAITGRAAGALGDVAVFDQAWKASWEIASSVTADARESGALLELAYGAASLQRWKEAEHALTHVLALAEQYRDAEIRLSAEAALADVQSRRSPETSFRLGIARELRNASGTLAMRFADALSGLRPSNHLSFLSP